jgi:hypothetical protein
MDCFFQFHSEKANQLQDFEGWTKLSDEDKNLLENKFVSIGSSSKPKEEVKKYEPAIASTKDNSTVNKKLKQQLDRLWKIKDGLKQSTKQLSHRTRKELFLLVLEYNDYHLEDYSDSALLDILADIMCFGNADKVKYFIQRLLNLVVP